MGRAVETLADDAHGPVLQISKKQNRELSYASGAGAKSNLSGQKI